MVNFLHQSFDKGSFAGEIIASLLIILLIKIVEHHFSSKKYFKICLMGGIFIGSIMLGQGIAYLTSSATIVFGIMPSAILSSIFFEEYSLLLPIIGAQLIGSFIGWFIYMIYNNLFKELKEESQKETSLNWKQFSFKETIAQIIYSMMILFITFSIWNKDTEIDISPIFMSIILLTSIISLLLIFSKVNMFMISPIITIFTISKKVNKKEVMTILSQISIQTISILIVGLSTIATKEI